MKPLLKIAGLTGLIFVALTSPALAQSKMPLPKCFYNEVNRETFIADLHTEIANISRAESQARDRAERDELELQWRALDAEVPQASYVPLCPPSDAARAIRNTPFGDPPPPPPPPPGDSKKDPRTFVRPE